MTEVASLHIKAQAGDIVRAEKDLDGFSRAAANAGKQADTVGTKATKAAQGIDKTAQASTKASSQATALASRLGTLAGALVAAASAAFSIGGYIKLADAWSDMQSTIGAAIKDMSAAPALMSRMVDLANASYSPLDQTVAVYSRNVGVLRDLGLSADQAADFTESLNHMLVITATKGERAASVQDQLSKAMAVGKLTGDGLETVLANGGRVAEALAKQLGTTVSGLRQMAADGKITSGVIAGALLSSLEAVREEAGNMPATVADGLTRIATGIQYLVGVFDQTIGASGALAGVLVSIGDALAYVARWAEQNGDTISLVFNSVIGTAIVGATVLIARFGVTWVASMVSSAAATVTLSGALAALRAALISTGIGVLIVGAGVLVGLFLQLVSAAGGFGEALTLIANVGREAIDRLGLGFEGLGRLVASVAAGLRATFASAFAFILQKFADLTQKVADGINNMFSAVGLDLGLTGIGSGAAADIAAYAAEEQNVANRQGAAAQTFFNAMTAPMESIKALRDAVKGAKDEVASIPPVAVAAGDALQNMGAAGGNAAKAAEDGVKTLKDHVSDFKTTLSGAFTGLVTGAMSLRDALGNVIGKLAEMAAMKAFETLWGGGLGRGVTSLLGGLFGFSHGGVFNAGKVTPFATGGVVSRPTMFPMAGGAGLMGEAGPEAIMPLRRGSDGKLGVAATSEGGARSLSVSIGFDATVGELRAWVRDEAGNVVAQARPALIRQSVAATNRAMASTKAFGSP